MRLELLENIKSVRLETLLSKKTGNPYTKLTFEFIDGYEIVTFPNNDQQHILKMFG